MEKKNTVLLTVIAVATLLVAVIGATFAYFSATVKENNKTQTVLKSAELGITFTGTQEIVAESITPGWTADKKFTVQNTSDYDMTFDINFTEVVNNFARPQDLTYSIAAKYTDSTNDSYTTASTVQMVGLNDTGVSSATKTDFTATGTLPVDGSVEGSNVVYGDKVTKIVRVFIPAHTTQEFTMTVNYTYLDISQNEDQGKMFRATVNVTANGIDAGSVQNSGN